MAGGISLHAVDVASGQPGAGLRVEIHRVDEADRREAVADARLGEDGALHHPITGGAGVVEAVYEVTFHLDDFFAAEQPPPPFPGLVPFRFRVFDAALHYHLPIKFTPWGFSLYRGA